MSVADMTAVGVWLIPTIMVIIVAIIACIHYFSSHKLNVANALAVANALLKNEAIRSIVESSIELAKSAWKSSGYNNDILTNVLNIVNENIIVELNRILQSADTDADKEIAEVFSKYHIIADDIAGISSSVLALMGYDDVKIKHILLDAMDKEKEEDNKEE